MAGNSLKLKFSARNHLFAVLSNSRNNSSRVPQMVNDRIKIAYCTDMDKSVLISNFEKRNWQSVNAEDDWNFYWASTTTCRNIFSVESGYRMQDNQ